MAKESAAHCVVSLIKWLVPRGTSFSSGANTDKMAITMSHAFASCMSRSALFAPAAERNKEPILDVLRAHAPTTLRPQQSHLFFLEVGSGYGEHVGHFLSHSFGKKPVIWQPSDYVDTYFSSIEAHCRSAFDNNKTDSLALSPAILDVREDIWPVDSSRDDYWHNPNPLFLSADEEFQKNKERKFDMVLSINMIHIAPSSCTHGLFSGASSVLCENGRLVMYGPFKIGGQHVSNSNVQFDAYLKAMNPDFGVRNLDSLIDLAKTQNLCFLEKIAMPANNFCLIFEKRE